MYQSSRKYLKRFQGYEAAAIYIVKFTKRHYSIQSVGEFMVLVLFTLSNNVLHLYQVLPKNLKGFQLQTRILESITGFANIDDG